MKKKIYLKISNTWEFNNKVSKVFDQHVRESIPFYNQFHKQIAKISEFYLKDNSIIYDLGCSTGNYIKEVCKLKKKNLNIYGVDESKTMLKLANFKIKNIKKNKIKFINNDLLKLKMLKSDLIVCSLMLPFFSRSKQVRLIKKIYNNLNVGGAAIFLNKSICSYSHFENIFNQLYYDFKLSMGIRPEDVLKKAKSLRSVHTLNTTQEDSLMLKKIGFKKIDIFFKYLNFTGFLVEK